MQHVNFYTVFWKVVNQTIDKVIQFSCCMEIGCINKVYSKNTQSFLLCSVVLVMHFNMQNNIVWRCVWLYLKPQPNPTLTLICFVIRSEDHTSELQPRPHLEC